MCTPFPPCCCNQADGMMQSVQVTDTKESRLQHCTYTVMKRRAMCCVQPLTCHWAIIMMTVLYTIVDEQGICITVPLMSSWVLQIRQPWCRYHSRGAAAPSEESLHMWQWLKGPRCDWCPDLWVSNIWGPSLSGHCHQERGSSVARHLCQMSSLRPALP